MLSGKPELSVRRERQRVVHHPVGLARVHVLAVRIRRGEQRAEEAVERGKRLGHVRGERQVRLGVVADREHVALRAQEAVHPPAVEFGPPALPRVIGIEEAAPLVVVAQPVGRVRLALSVGEREPRLATVGTGKPPEVVVERPVLHHQHDERVDRQVARGRDLVRALPARRLGHDRVGIEHQPEPGRQPRRHRGALEELTPGVVRVGRDRVHPLGVERIPDVAHAPARGAHGREP